jgi:tetratricopeptide (TPR) repeat protein
VDEAIAAFEKALAVDPRSPLPRLHVAELLDRLGRHEEAARAYQQFLGVASPVLLAAQAQRARARLHELRGGPR